MSINIVIWFTNSQIDISSTFFHVPQHVTIMRNRFAPSSQIYITTICTMIREMLRLPMFLPGFILVMPKAYGRFSQIVKARPYHIAYDIWTLNGVLPVGKSIARIAFCLPHHTLRATLMVAFCLVHHIVVAHDVEHRSMRVVDFPVAVPCT